MIVTRCIQLNCDQIAPANPYLQSMIVCSQCCLGFLDERNLNEISKLFGKAVEFVM